MYLWLWYMIIWMCVLLYLNWHIEMGVKRYTNWYFYRWGRKHFRETSMTCDKLLRTKMLLILGQRIIPKRSEYISALPGLSAYSPFTPSLDYLFHVKFPVCYHIMFIVLFIVQVGIKKIKTTIFIQSLILI